MTENQNLNRINRIRKVMARKSKYELPEEDLILDSEDIEYEQDKTNYWLESFSNKSQYDITENLCVNW